MSGEKNMRLEIRVTPAEKQKLKENANKVNMTVSEYILTLADGKPIIVVEEFAQILKEIKRIGINVNQLARVANSNKYITKKQIAALENHNANVTELLKEMLNTITEIKETGVLNGDSKNS